MKKIFLLLVGLMLLLNPYPAFSTVESTAQTITYTASGSQATFTFPFSVDAPSEIKLLLNGTVEATNLYTVSCTPIDWDVSLNPIQWDCSTGGSVTFNTTPSSGAIVVITTNIPINQGTAFTENMPALYKSFENGLDKLTRIDKQLSILNNLPSGAGILTGNGSGYGTPIAESDGKVVYGSGGVWTTSSAPALSIANMTGTQPISRGGTGATTAGGALTNLGALSNPMTTTGDIIVGGASGAPARYADVAANQPLLSGGAGVAPAYAGYYLSGTSTDTYTFPSASKTLAANDGSNWTISGQAVGDLNYATSTTAYGGRLAAATANQPLISKGTTTAPAYAGYYLSGTAAQTYTFPASTCTLQSVLTNPVTGTGTNYYLPVWTGSGTVGALATLGSANQVLTSNGAGAKPTWQNPSTGFSSPMTTLGDTLYENSTPAAARLAGNISTTKEFFTQTGTGSASAAPVWGTLASADIPNNAANTSGTATTAINLTGTTANTLPYQSASATTSYVGPVNNAVLSTNGIGVPSESTSLPSGLTIPSPTMTTPTLGTPASGILTSCTGLPLSTGVTGIAPIVSGGTGTGSTLTGLVRGSSSAMTAAELSGDATTSGSNAVTVNSINGTSLAGLNTGILKNTSGTGVPSIAVAGTDYQAPLANAITGTGTQYYIPYWTGSSVQGTLASLGTNGYVLTSNGAGAAPTWQVAPGAGSIGGSGTQYYLTCWTGVSGVGPLASLGTANQVLTSNGAGAYPTWQNSQAGFTNPMTTLGDIIVENSTPAADRLAGNTTSTKKFLTQTGTGTISALPGWNTLVSGDIPANAANTSGSSGSCTGNSATATTATNLAGTVVGEIPYQSGSGATTYLADVAAGSPLVSGGVTTAPLYAAYLFSGTSAATYTFPAATKTLAANDGSNLAIASQTTGDLLVASSTTAYGRLADVAANSPLISGGTGSAPAYASYLFSGTSGKTYTFPAYTNTLEAGGDYQQSYSSSFTVNWQNGATQEVTLTGNPTISFSNWVNGLVCRLVLVQDGTGTRTVTWSGTIKWQGGSAPTLTTTASKADIITFLYGNGIVYASATQNF